MEQHPDSPPAAAALAAALEVISSRMESPGGREVAAGRKAEPDIPHFTPVRVRARVDGWTPERQRRYVASLARWGSARRAAAEVGLSEQSACRLRRRPDAASFARACEAACRIGKIRRRAAADPAAFFGPGGLDFPTSMNLPRPGAGRQNPRG